MLAVAQLVNESAAFAEPSESSQNPITGPYSETIDSSQITVSS
jgi:hypothetical protein